MRNFSEVVVSTGIRFQSLPFLKWSWAGTLAFACAGCLLLAFRISGSLVPSTSPLFNTGLLLMLYGSLVTAYWSLFQASRSEKHLPLQAQPDLGVLSLLGWAMLLMTGATTATLALIPAASLVGVLMGVVGLLTVAGLMAGLFLTFLQEQTATLQRPLFASSSDKLHSTTNASETMASVKKNNPEPLAAASQPQPPKSPLKTWEVPAEISAATEPSSSSEQLVQWLSRKQDYDGTETVEGMVRLELAAGQTQRSAHVAFAPSLKGVPEMECEPLSETEVEAILGDVYPHGFRVEIRRTTQDRSPQTIEIGFQAVCPAQNQNAA